MFTSLGHKAKVCEEIPGVDQMVELPHGQKTKVDVVFFYSPLNFGPFEAISRPYRTWERVKIRVKLN